MADPKNTKGTTAPAAPATKPANPAPAEAAPAKAKREKAVYQEVFPTAEAALEAAGQRKKGPRRAFTCTLGDQVFYVVGHNEGRAGGIAFKQLKGKVEELGKVKKTKAVGVEGILAALSALSEEDRKAIQAVLAK